jgi:nitroreductase
MERRTYNAEILQEIKDRWSPRAFSPEKIESEDLTAILEAARYAPSCFNEQPWRFIIGQEDSIRTKILESLTEQHRAWASKAPILIVVLAKKAFEYNGNDNYWHMFDAGTAWGYLSLEAQRRGLISHGMGGFSKKAIYESFALSEDYAPIAVVAIGKYGDPEQLPIEQRSKENPGTRKALQDLIIIGDLEA